jgi:molybdopterin converting factor subunit 1
LSIRVTLLYFGQARDGSGRGEEAFTLPTGSSIDALVKKATVKHPRLQKLKTSAQVALNEEIASGGDSLKDGDVVALLPPVAGG